MKTMFLVISMANGSRRATFHQPEPGLQLNWKFMDAATQLVDGIEFDAKLSYRHSKRRLSQPEIGCHCSHMLAWREFLASDCSQLVVLEDDVHADWDYLAQAASIDWSRLGIDYLKFFLKYPAKFDVLAWSYPIVDRHLVQYRTLALGTQTYLLTRRAAERFEQSFRVISRALDVEMDRAWATGIPVVGLTPPASVEMTRPSTMSGRTDPSDISRHELLQYYAGRAVEKGRAMAYRLFGPSLRLRSQ